MFNLKAANDQEIGRSAYDSSNAAMENGIASVQKNRRHNGLTGYKKYKG